MGPITEEKAPSSLPTSSSQAQQAGAAQGVDVISDLIRQGSDADAAAMTAAKAAAVPVSGGHTTPQAVMLPGGGQQHQQLAMDTNPVVGHHQALQRGIANATRGVANLVSSVSTQVEQKQTQRLAVNMERLMTATQSMDQAKQVLQSDPNNATAQDQLKRSGAIMDEVLSDDKTRKSIQKAYNINFTDPSKNNTKEHAALKMATDSYKEQFQKQLPQQMAPNQAAIEQAKLAQAQAAATHKTIDAIIPAVLRQQATLGAAGIKAESAEKVEASKEAFAWTNSRQKAQESYRKALDTANTSGHYHLAGIAMAQQHDDDRFFSKLDAATAKAGGKLANMPTKDLLSAIKEADALEAKAPKTRSDLIKVRNLMQKDPKKYNAQALAAANANINLEESNLAAQQTARKTLLEEYNRRLTSGGSSATSGSESKPNSQAATSSGTTRAATLQDVDPDPEDDSSN